MKDYIFRAVNPRSDSDMQKYFALAEKLSKFLKNGASFDENQMRWARIRMGSVEYVDLQDYINRTLPNIEDNAREFVFVCEYNDEFVGYVDICDYHARINGEVIEDDIGAINEIFVDKECRTNHFIAEKLLKMAVEKLISKGKTKAVCEVQEDNPNRFLHFAMMDKILEQDVCTRVDGTETMDWILLIDLIKIQKMSGWDIAKKAAKLKRKFQQQDNMITR